MVWGASFWQNLRQSSIGGAVVAVLFVVVFCLLGLAGVSFVDGFHLAGG